MPLVLDVDSEASAELDEVVEFLYAEHIDTRDISSLTAAGPMLKKLGNNRAFLADMAIRELKDLCASQDEKNGYTAQVMMLAPPDRPGQNFFIRANFWPSAKDALFRSTGAASFSYAKPHDHNFNFLTVGYLGPGYWSNYYEYDHGSVVGVTGEKVGLTFVGKSRLEEGSVMLYRAFRDVHDQLPPDAMSISLNICENTLRGSLLNQYSFDVEKSELANILNRHSAIGLMPVAACLAGEAGCEILMDIYRRHPSDRLKFLALKAVAGAMADPAAATDLFRSAARDSSPLVAGFSNREIASIQAAVDRATLAPA